MSDFISATECEILANLEIELKVSEAKFKRRLSIEDMRIAGQILIDLYFRRENQYSTMGFIVTDWIAQADTWFGEGIGMSLANTIQPTSMYSCFISYNHHDEDFAYLLYTHLKDAKISAWYAPHYMKGGEKTHHQIYKAVASKDKIILILSENSIKSEWVTTEIRRARKIENEQGKQKLFPIRLVDINTIRKWECFDADIGKDLATEIREYFIPDFSNWEDTETFDRSFARLLDDLKIPFNPTTS